MSLDMVMTLTKLKEGAELFLQFHLCLVDFTDGSLILS